MAISTLEGTDGWSFGKADRAIAYINLATGVSAINLAHVEIFRPISWKWYEVRPETILSGSPAEVMRYNVTSRLFGALISKILGIRTISFVYNFGFPMRSSISASAMLSCRAAAELYDMVPKSPKRRYIEQDH